MTSDKNSTKIPMMQASLRTEAAYRKALLEKDKAIEVINIKKYFRDLLKNSETLLQRKNDQ